MKQPSHSSAAKPHPWSSRAFTLLETMLAAVLGAMVILVAFSLFTVVQRSDKRSQIKMEENLELAHAHKTIARTFHMLLMSSETRPNESETNEFLKKDDERNSADLAEQEDEEASSTRVSIQPDINNPMMMLIGTEDRQRQARSQVVTLTLRTSPVLGDGDKTPEQEFIDQIERERVLARASTRLSDRLSGRSSSSRRGENSNAAMSEAMGIVDKATGGRSGGKGGGDQGASGKRLSLREKNAAGRSGGGRSSGSSSDEDSGPSLFDDNDDDRTASERLEDEEEDRPRAPGVRGVFEILPDGVDAGGGTSEVDVRSARLQEAGASGQSTYSLWWRELPSIEINNDGDASASEDEEKGKNGDQADGDQDDKDNKDNDKDRDSRRSSRDRDRDAAGDQIDREVQRLAEAADTTGKRVRLLSGLTTCHWTAFRGRKERDKITAKFDSHLPAFVELEIVTASGRRENWIFDVAWTIGAEPGSVLPETSDSLNNGLVTNPPGTGDPVDPNNNPRRDENGNPIGGNDGKPGGNGSTNNLNNGKPATGKPGTGKGGTLLNPGKSGK